ncbi:hypothetical protein AVEN_183281-1 [Araneus ventricosus]|uniref:TTF-type domain-containing protein n=1 Tax=Araneus ventricosus TaxID=182803 RepID=A0A4Y2EVC6_ARAVE|nr:hypothetical protein AVEN_183281-1 [Araneus ventricosus]
MEVDKEKRKLRGSHYRQMQKKLLLEKNAKNTQKKESATVNLSLNADTVEADSGKETPAVTSKLAPLKKLSMVQHLLLNIPCFNCARKFLKCFKNRDFALFCGTDTVVDDAMKKQLIEEGFWHPGMEYKFPQSSKDNRSFQFNWLNRFNWLAYNEKEGGAYCKLCVIFAPDHNAEQTFISKPTRNIELQLKTI